MRETMKMALGLGISAALLALPGCSETGRAMKTMASDWGGGLKREVKVYDAVGDVLFEQQGKFDIETNETGTKILYDDDKGMRHIFYLGSGTCIVNEIP